MDLSPFNSFGISASCEQLDIVSSDADYNKIIVAAQNKQNFLILGGGSNVLFVEHFNGIVFLIRTSGVELQGEDDTHVVLSVAAGEDWHQFVTTTLERGYYGLENLALIPGTVGAAPIQNIGAYGVEVQQKIESVSAIDLTTGEEKLFSKKDCCFGYRDSLFKQQLGRWCIKRVVFKLNKQFNPTLNYQPLEDLYQGRKNTVTAKEVFNKVIEIRRSKLPDPKVLGNAGSFFKNPVISESQYQELLAQFPNLPSYKIDENYVKVPAGWLIDKLGFKGKTYGGASVHTQQALVLVNRHNATGADVLGLANSIEQAVLNHFNIQLEREVRVIR